ncbi:MAG: carbohydrate binding family 9 domain-containing protein [Cytophagales bacterium]|nr:carbohydrate binding family 9 domain-containing protein [Cytophagales bacterium]
MTILKITTLLGFIFLAQIATAQLSSRPVTTASKMETNPTLDGDVINDLVWQSINPIIDMIQVRPDNGQPASERTEIRVAYTSTIFYLSVVCYDASPERLVVSDSRRDASLDGTDSFLFILDTYNDGQNGFVFGTSSNGVEYDGQVDNEGQQVINSNRQQGGFIGGFNLNWDTSWEVQTEVGDYGWSAEFAIPLRSLRFNSGDNQSWGINFQRNIRKTNEVAYWAPLPLQFDLNRLSLAGDINGLDLRNPGNLKVIPYVLGRASKNFETTANPKTDFEGEVGLDVKYSITPGMTLDLTYNTDFAQVEVDDEQVNLDRFNLFFPEKRPFFLENAGQFSIGSPGEVDLFFSRRIGIGEEGQIVPIIGGARVSGKINDTYVGVLSMFTEDVSMPDVAIERNNFSVLRVNHQLAERSTIGAAIMNRQSMGGLQSDLIPTNSNQYNGTYAVDGKLGLGKKAQLSGFYAKTSSPGISTGDHSYKMQAQYTWNGWRLNLAYTEVAENFNPELGFLSRSAYRKPEFLILKTIRYKEENKMNMLEIRPHISYRGFWNFDNFQETGFLHIDNHWVWRRGFEIHTGINITTEGVVEDFEISDGIIVNTSTYEHAEGQIVIITNPSKNVYLSTRHVFGGAFGGERYINSGTVGLRFGNKFNSEFSLRRNDFSLPNGNFKATVLGSRVSYSFTPRIFTQSPIQYNSVAKVWSANLRFGLLEQANTGLFVVFNKAWGKGDGIVFPTKTGYHPNNQSFTIKYTHLFDVIR